MESPVKQIDNYFNTYKSLCTEIRIETRSIVFVLFVILLNSSFLFYSTFIFSFCTFPPLSSSCFLPHLFCLFHCCIFVLYLVLVWSQLLLLCSLSKFFFFQCHLNVLKHLFCLCHLHRVGFVMVFCLSSFFAIVFLVMHLLENRKNNHSPNLQ